MAETLYEAHKKFKSFSYSDKLKFWDENKLHSETNYNIYKGGKNEKHFSIKPDGEEESGKYGYFLLTRYNFDFAVRKEQIFESLRKFTSKISKREYLERELQKVSPAKDRDIFDEDSKLNHLFKIDKVKNKELPDFSKMGTSTMNHFFRVKMKIGRAHV